MIFADAFLNKKANDVFIVQQDLFCTKKGLKKKCALKLRTYWEPIISWENALVSSFKFQFC